MDFIIFNETLNNKNRYYQGQNRPESNNKEGVLHIPQIF